MLAMHCFCVAALFLISTSVAYCKPSIIDAEDVVLQKKFVNKAKPTPAPRLKIDLDQAPCDRFALFDCLITLYSSDANSTVVPRYFGLWASCT